MSALSLSFYIDKILQQLERFNPPTRDVRIVELNKATNGQFHIKRDDLFTVAEYAPRFDTLVSKGDDCYVMLDCQGAYDGFLIVSVETTARKPCTAVIVGEGTPRKIVDGNWSLDRLVVIE